MILAIIDHAEHQLFIESVDDNEIINKYNGEEEDYIIDKFHFNSAEDFSWEYLTKRVEVFGEKKHGDVSIHHN